ncbi:MAG: hypothetical protein PUB10_01820 [Clostridiales bacterium]|nr:hypothetical protein [Clostridiales bacterium]
MKRFKKKITTLLTLAAVTAVSIGSGAFVNPQQAEAKISNVISLDESKKRGSSKIDLTGDGVKETLKVSMKYSGRTGTVKFSVDGKTALTLKQELNRAEIHYLDFSSDQQFIWVEFLDNDYRTLDRIYQYDPVFGKFKCVLTPYSETVPNGANDIMVTEIKEKDSNLIVSYSGQMMATGRIKWNYTYEYSGDKFTLKSTTAKAAGVDKSVFTAKKKINLYSDTNKNNVAFSVKKGTKLKLNKIKLSKGSFYLQFSKDGQSGWVKADEYGVFNGVEIAG